MTDIQAIVKALEVTQVITKVTKGYMSLVESVDRLSELAEASEVTTGMKAEGKLILKGMIKVAEETEVALTKLYSYEDTEFIQIAKETVEETLEGKMVELAVAVKLVTMEGLA